MYRRLTPLLAAICVAAFAACSSDRDLSSSSAPDTTPTSEASTSTAAPSSSTSLAPTTEAPTTPPAPPTTPAPTPPPPPPLPVLYGAGIGTSAFGDTDDDVLAYLTGPFGGVSSDSTTTLDVEVGIDSWESFDGEIGYIAPLARDVCFAGTPVCVVFGGAVAADLAFTGWYYFDESGVRVESIEGIKLDDLWSDHVADLTRLSGGCYSFGYAESTDGILVGMISNGENFNQFDDTAGTFIDLNPNPADVFITSMEAGDLIRNNFADC